MVRECRPPRTMPAAMLEMTMVALTVATVSQPRSPTSVMTFHARPPS